MAWSYARPPTSPDGDDPASSLLPDPRYGSPTIVRFPIPRAYFAAPITTYRYDATCDGVLRAFRFVSHVHVDPSRTRDGNPQACIRASPETFPISRAGYPPDRKALAALPRTRSDDRFLPRRQQFPGSARSCHQSSPRRLPTRLRHSITRNRDARHHRFPTPRSVLTYPAVRSISAGGPPGGR